MKNKGFVIFLTVLISALCIYYLSFTFVSQSIQKGATEKATDSEGNIDFRIKQRYLDSIWNAPVYNLLGAEYTYKDIKETELNLGLDLQGGMHVTLEVSPVDILKGISGNSQDPIFLASLSEAKNNIVGTQKDFVSEFATVYSQKSNGKPLASVFATAANKGRINQTSTDDEVLAIINEEVESAIDRAFEILRTRIDRFGTSQPNIQRLQGTGRIQIELPGVDNPQRVRKLLQGVAKLEFLEVYELQEISDILQKINDIALAKLGSSSATSADGTSSLNLGEALTADENLTGDSLAVASAPADTAIASLDSALNSGASEFFSLIKSGGGLFYSVKDTSRINRILESPEVQASLPNTLKFLWLVKPIKSDNSLNAEEILELYAIKQARNGKAPLTGEVIIDARQDLDERSRPAVAMQMNAQGAKIWKKLTANNINRRIAIVLDNYVYSAPVVQGEIPNGNSSISGNFEIEEAQDLANILKAGALPAPTTIVEDVVIGPTLGKVAQSQGINSIFAGLLIVLFFMVAYYAKSGAVANVALFFNIFFILGILAQLSAALTLPGIAGIVLTMGMAIDANVLIFERIREELKYGTGMKQAIATGYKKAYATIFDSNATTIIIGIILYSFGQGPVKGFAITLIIGIISSFFSAVFISRVIIEFLSKKGDQSKLTFDTKLSRDIFKNQTIDFLGKSRIAYVFSGTFIFLGILAMVFKGFTMGVDFKGGRSFVVMTQSPIVPSEWKAQLSGVFDNSGVEVKSFGANNVVKVTTSYMIEDESDVADAQVREKLIEGLTAISGKKYIENDNALGAENFTISSSSKVSSTIADDIKSSSLFSGVLALIAIFIYILVRFRKWQFGLGAIIALFHDVLFVLSAFAIANVFGISLEVDQVFIAALLTVIGYSINDTVVVFDRVRETTGVKKGSELHSVFNESLNNTLSRTMITSLTTLIVVIILFLFGGAVLTGFSFALLVGIIIGTYSSLYIATPLALEFMKKS